MVRAALARGGTMNVRVNVTLGLVVGRVNQAKIRVDLNHQSSKAANLGRRKAAAWAAKATAARRVLPANSKPVGREAAASAKAAMAVTATTAAVAVEA